MPVVEPKSKEDFEDLLKDAGDRLVVIKFFATWCGPCRMMAPKFLKLSDEFTEILCLEIDVDEQDEIVAEYDIKVMPTFIFVKNGEQQITLEGNNVEELRKNMSSRK